MARARDRRSVGSDTMEHELPSPLSDEDRIAACRTLRETVRDEVGRRDTPTPVFHGAWDWHSAVHGHWALLKAAAILGEADDAWWVINRLRSGAFEGELQHLLAEPDFELPYGRAWLLRLGCAYEDVTGDPGLRPDLQPIAEGLRRWVDGEGLGPETDEYDNPCWALLQLQAWHGRAGTDEALSWLRRQVESRFLRPGVLLAEDLVAPGRFFSRWALQARLIGQVLGDGALRRWLEAEDADPEAIPIVPRLHSAHHLGIHASRAWGAWSAFEATGDRRWRDLYERHLAASFGLHASWKDDRHAYAHWVPQFTLYALALSMEDHPLALSEEDRP